MRTLDIAAIPDDSGTVLRIPVATPDGPVSVSEASLTVSVDIVRYNVANGTARKSNKAAKPR